MAQINVGSAIDNSVGPEVEHLDLIDETKPSRVDLPIEDVDYDKLSLTKSHSRGSRRSFNKLASHDELCDSGRREKLEENFKEVLPLPTKMNVFEKPVSMPVDIKKPTF